MIPGPPFGVPARGHVYCNLTVHIWTSFFCAIVVFNFHLCLFCQRRGNGPTATIALPAHDHLLLESYFAHFNILCSFTSVFMFSLYSYFVKEEGVTAQVIHDFVIVPFYLYLCFYICICICICSYTFIPRRGNDGKAGLLMVIRPPPTTTGFPDSQNKKMMLSSKAHLSRRAEWLLFVFVL